MVQRHGFTSTELEEMLPFERDIYVSLAIAKLNEQQQQG